MKLLYLFAGLSVISGCSWWNKCESVEVAAHCAPHKMSHEPFTALDINGPFLITYMQGAEHSIRVSGDAEQLQRLELSYLGGMAHIALPDAQKNEKTLYIEVMAPYLDAVYLAGATTGRFTGIERDVLTIRAAGAYASTFEGTVNTVRITASGAGAIDAQALEADSADIEASGASTVKVAAKNELSIKAYGATTIQYRGDPKIAQETAGAAVIQHIE